MRVRYFVCLLGVVWVVAPCAALAAATVSHADFVALIKRIPPPPTSIRQTLARRDNQQITAQFAHLNKKINHIHRHLHGMTLHEAQASGVMSQATQKAFGMPKTPVQAAALQKKLAGMTRQQKMAFMMRLRRQQVEAAVNSGAAHVVKPLSPAEKAAYQKLLAISQRFNPTKRSASNSYLFKPFTAADSQLDAALKALAHRYPLTTIPGVHGSDEMGYEHANHLCHADFDNRINRSRASVPVYNVWLHARHDAWVGKAQKISAVAVREQSLLKTIRYGDALRDKGHDIAYRNVIDLQIYTLSAIQQLAGEAKETSDRSPGNVTQQTNRLRATLAECLTAT